MNTNERQRNPTLAAPLGADAHERRSDEKGAAALDDRFIEIRFDVGLPLRPQFDAARAAVTDFALGWLRRNPGARPLRIGKKKNQTFYIECARIHEAMRQGADRDAISRELWPGVDHAVRRRRVAYRIARWRLLVERHYLELAAAERAFGQTSVGVVFPFLARVD